MLGKSASHLCEAPRVSRRHSSSRFVREDLMGLFSLCKREAILSPYMEIGNMPAKKTKKKAAPKKTAKKVAKKPAKKTAKKKVAKKKKK